MTRHSTTTLLVIIAALLALDIALRLSPQEATAQQPEFPGPPEELFFYTSLGMHSFTANSSETTIFRLRGTAWSSGESPVSEQVGPGSDPPGPS